MVMSYRYTNTEKWSDSWFSGLTQIQMLLFMYLCDNCDIAGFIEVNYKRWAVDLNSSVETIQGASKGLQRGLVFSKNEDCIFIKNFLRHQKNLPLNENNKAHLGILKRFSLYSQKFNIQDVNEFIEGASKGLLSPTGNGNGIGSGIGKGKEQEKSESEKLNFPFQSIEFFNAWDILVAEPKWRKKTTNALQQSLIKLSKYPEHIAIEMINNAIAGNWQGLFEIDDKKNNYNKPIGESKTAQMLRELKEGTEAAVARIQAEELINQQP